MRHLLCLAAVLCTVVAAGCGGGDEEPAAAPAPDDDATSLAVVVTGAASQPIRMRLRCGGTCDRERLAMATAPADPARACTLLYGGPEEAHVTGKVGGKPVDVRIHRRDGCGVAAYEALFAAFGRRAPVAG